jgi:uncharacterized protein (DUF111 family)
MLIDTLISETGTLGVRIRTSNRYVVPRIVISVPITIGGKNYTVRCKVVKHNDVIKHFKIESDDIRDISNSLNISFRDANELITAQAKEKLHLK